VLVSVFKLLPYQFSDAVMFCLQLWSIFVREIPFQLSESAEIVLVISAEKSEHSWMQIFLAGAEKRRSNRWWSKGEV